MLTAALAAAALAIAVTTPLRSGPYCSMSCIAYPYTNAAAFVPRDYVWMYPAALLSVTFVVLVTCVHRHARDDLKSCSLVAMCFASLVETHQQEDECQLEGQGQSGNAISGLLAYYCWSGRWCGGREGRHQRGEARLIRRGETPAATTVTVGSFRPFGNGMEIDASCHSPYRDTQCA
jgi:hypothetical protein